MSSSLTATTPVRATPDDARGQAPSGRVAAGVRKFVVYREDILHENGREPARPARRAVAAAVITNPWWGSGPAVDLSPQVEVIAPVLAKALTHRLAEALGGVEAIEAFGKAAIVGTGGEIEHGGALIHTPWFGNLVRDLLEGESIICFTDARAEAGGTLVVPMWHKTRAATRSHYQTIPVRVPDAPRAGEIVVIAAASTGPRPHARIGDRTTDPAVSADNLEGAPSW